MIAIDTNVLVAAQRGGAMGHAHASSALAGLVADGSAVGIPWPCVHEFWNVVTHPRIFDPPTTTVDAVQFIAALLRVPRIRPLTESARHLDLMADLMSASAAVVGPKVHDARIAAICLGHGVTELWTADRDFSYFPALRTRNPLVG